MLSSGSTQKDRLYFVGSSSDRNRDSSPTGQFTDTHFEDSSPTELKTVHRQN